MSRRTTKLSAPRPAASAVGGTCNEEQTTAAPGNFESRLTAALEVQRMLLANDLLTLHSMMERSEPPLPEYVEGLSVRKGRVEAFLYALRILWGEKQFASFCEAAGVQEDELSALLQQETDSFSD